MQATDSRQVGGMDKLVCPCAITLLAIKGLRGGSIGCGYATLCTLWLNLIVFNFKERR